MEKLLILSFFFCSVFVLGQFDTIQISRQQAESIFLENNLELIAERLNINLAEAEVIQAGLWPNPTLEISEVNLWKLNPSETLPPLIGKWGKHQQIAIEWEQPIITSGKRRKQVALEKVNQEKTKIEFQDLLRNLKFEFRNNLTELQFLQAKELIFNNLTYQLEILIKAYKIQFEERNISKNELIRLQTMRIGFNKEINEIIQEKNEIVKNLKIAMNLPAEAHLILKEEDFELRIQELMLFNEEEIIKMALENRPDLKISELNQDYFNKKLIYEKAQRTPDINLTAGYDRGGGIMQDFVGFGFSVDLPFFDRNQGNIQAAQIEINQSQILHEYKKAKIQSEVVKDLRNLWTAQKMLENIDSEYEKDLDQLLPAHQEHFQKRNINLLEYIDFVESYIQSKENILELKRNIQNHYEKILFVIGKDL